MATPFPFTAGQVLTAAQMNAITELIINDKTDSYTLTAGDAGERVIMNKATATTITVPNSVFAAGQVVYLANKGAGTCTVTAGAGTTVSVNGSLAMTQYGGGTLLALSASTFIFFPGSSVSTLSVDYLLVGGGGGGGRTGAGYNGGGGGGAGGLRTASDLIAKANTYTITVGAGGSGQIAGGATQRGENGTASSFIRSANGGGGGGGANAAANAGQVGGSGGGGCIGGVGGSGISGEGSNGGNSVANAGGGGGGSAAVGAAGAGTTGGNGGTATANSYTGSSISYSGGGGGGGTTGGTAGTNAGNGGSGAGNGAAATANRGGGGGGNGNDGTNSGNGGSGRVVLQILTSNLNSFTVTTTGSPTTGTNGSYTYYAYDSTGTFRID